MQDTGNENNTEDHEEKIKPKTWLGTSLAEVCHGMGPWKFYTPPVTPSRYHKILYQLPVDPQEQPVPRYNSQDLAWDENHVRMPFNPKNLYRVNENGIDVLKCRWEVIKKALSEPISSSHDLEKAIKKYNNQVPQLEALHNFFQYVLEDEDTNQFFTCVLPGIIDLALHLPELLPGNVPLLKKKDQNKAVSLSQVQVASLMANAFLCTFPWRKDVAVSYPGVNFVRLFASNPLGSRQSCVSEKLKCICHYFRRILSKHPTGIITFERHHVSKSNMPRWDTLDKNLGNVKLHIDSAGTIEDNGLGFLQVDFANKNIGGGVLSYGCVQEEIRFVVCPELIISRLFIEQLGDNDSVVIIGAERYSKYAGYGEDFKWDGDVIDETPFDEYGRRKTSIVVIDATYYPRPSDQFYPSAILREVNKAYVGFHSREKQNLAPVATGNWGCGAFQGSPFLKTLIQLMACCATNRDLVYFSFGDEDLRDDFYDMYLFLGNNRITVKQLWKFLSTFAATKLPQSKLYSYVQQSYFDSKKKKSLRDYLRNNQDAGSSVPSSKKKDKDSMKNTPNIETVSHSSSSSSNSSRSPAKRIGLEKQESSQSCSFTNVTETNTMETQDISPSSESNDDVIPSSQTCGEISLDPRALSIKKKLPKNHDKILSLIESDDVKNREMREEMSPSPTSFLSELDKVKKQKPNTSGEVKIDIGDSDDMTMDVDDFPRTNNSLLTQKKPHKKITDYFTKINKPA